MSLVQKLKKYFSNHAETRDHHEDTDLQTRYYKTTKDQALMIIENFITNSQIYELNSISKTHGEISILKKKGKKLFIIASIIMVKPYETAIDFRSEERRVGKECRSMWTSIDFTKTYSINAK